MRTVWEVSRRKFLGLLGAIGLARAGKPLAAAVFAAPPAPAQGYKVLTAAQVATLEAIAGQIVPADQDPGAREAGAVHYIDNVLAGYQSDKRALYASGIEGTDQTSQLLFGHAFAQLSFDQQTAVLKSIEQGKARGEIWQKASSRDFFAMVWQHVLEGYYGPPEEGGNKECASWKMVGFPPHYGML